MRDLESILQQMKSFGMYYFRLYVKEGFNEIPVVATTGATEGAKENYDPDNAVMQLQSAVSYYDSEPNTVFLIELFKASNSNATGKTGKIKFVKNLNAYKPAGAAPDAALAGVPSTYLTNLGQVQEQNKIMFEERLGHIMKMSDEKLELNNLKLELKQERAQLEKERKEFEDDKIATYADVAQLKAEYTSQKGKMQSSFEKALEVVLIRLVPSLPDMAMAAAGGPTLAGAQAQVVTQPERTEKELIIEDVANNVDDHINDLFELKVWGMITNKFITEPLNIIFNDFREKAKAKWPS